MIFGIALLVFGPRKLPELGKGIGEGIRGFKAAINGEEKPARREDLNLQPPGPEKGIRLSC